ncbi:MauE/DoxX family redox-associated membrane protein [Chloroflexota bacterium]
MKDKIQQFLNSGKILLSFRLLLGSILVAASLGKIADPNGFVNLVTSYNILPEGLAQPFGVFLPWVELITGGLLILGFFPRLVAGISIILIAGFMIASSSSLLAGTEASCGCFGGAMPLSYTQSLLINGAMLLMAVPLLLRRDEPWLAFSRFPTSRAFFTTMAILLVLGSFLPRATLAAAAVNVDETPVTSSQQVASNTGTCGGVVGVEAENVIKAGPDTSYGQGSIDLRISDSLQTSDAVFLFFYADWCGFCKKEKPTIDALEQQYSGQISFLRLNNEKEAEAFRKFGVTGFPTMYLITDRSENGDYISQAFVGYTDEAKLRSSFDQVISGGGGPYQGSVSATIAPLANDPAPVPNSGSGTVTCFGIPGNDPGVCSGHGTCVGTDNCQCDAGWTGLDCEFEEVTHYYCNGIWQGDSSVCSTHGTCGNDGLCTCAEGYSGSDCETIATCNDIPYTDENACGEHGTCTVDGQCVCEAGYYTADPLTPCEAVLKCGDGYYLIDGTDPEACNFQGDCVFDNNGELGKCVCQDDFTGPTCQQPRMCNNVYSYESDVCNGLGDCLADGLCDCVDGVSGDFCENDNRHCGGFYFDDPGVCNGNGICLYNEQAGQHQCECYSGYYGVETYCYDLVTCNGVPGNFPEACGEHGTCVGPDTCECDTNWEGANCDQVIECNGVAATDPNTCSGYGICTIDGECVCDAEHLGYNCQSSVECGGLSPYDPLVCGGTMICTKDGCVPPNECDRVLYGVNTNDDGLSIIDPNTGVVNFIGPLDPNVCTYSTPVAMAIRPTDGEIFVWNNSNGTVDPTGPCPSIIQTGVLLTVDRNTGLAAEISTTNQGLLGALAYAPDGTLYGMGGKLYTIDDTTGDKTPVHPTNTIGFSIGAADFDSSGILYGVEYTTRKLVTIDTTTGIGTLVGTLTGSETIGVIGSIAFAPDGTLICSSFGAGGNKLFDVDKTTGAATNFRSITGANSSPQGMGFSCASNHPPVASLIVDPYPSTENYPVDLIASASSDPDAGDILQYRWDLNGDGNWDTSYNSSPIYDGYFKCDDYSGTVKVEVTDGQLSDIAETTVTFTNLPPDVLDLSADRTVVYVSETVHFTGIGKDPGCDNLTAEWKGTDGLYFSESELPPAYNANLSHQYLTPGIHTVRLKLTDDEGDWDSETITIIVLASMRVNIDIKPTSCPNPLNVKSGGVLPVAILGTSDFDVTTIDPTTITLMGEPVLRWEIEDVATPYDPANGGEGRNACSTEGPDGYQDLTLKFNKRAIVEALGDLKDGQVLYLELKGQLLNGIAIEGKDVVWIINKADNRKGKNK